jgi:hypothetical protein
MVQRLTATGEWHVWHALRYSEGRAQTIVGWSFFRSDGERNRSLASMRIIDPNTGESYVEKRRLRRETSSAGLRPVLPDMDESVLAELERG